MYQKARADGGFDAGIEMALSAVLVSPQFLFRVEQDPAGVPPGTPYRISDLELASRLSFFLWSSIPDDQLLDVRRLLERSTNRRSSSGRCGGCWPTRGRRRSSPTSPRSGCTCETSTPSRRTCASFRTSTTTSGRRSVQETELFVESVLREDRSVLDLLTRDYTFVNERLAKHYGIPHVYGEPLPADCART